MGDSCAIVLPAIVHSTHSGIHPDVRENLVTVDAYIADRILSSADPVYEAILRANASAGLPAIDVSPAQGKFLHLIVKIGARRVLEIGTLGGYSTIWLARRLSSGGRLITLEYLAPCRDCPRQHRAGRPADRWRSKLARRSTFLPARTGPFDLIFIDADKPNNLAYLDWALKLRRPGSVIIVDNVVRDGRVTDASSDGP